jgi:hypothetical protein
MKMGTKLFFLQFKISCPVVRLYGWERRDAIGENFVFFHSNFLSINSWHVSTRYETQSGI